MSFKINKIRNIFHSAFSSAIKKGNASSPIRINKQLSVNLNYMPANFSRPKINNLSSKLLLEGRGKSIKIKEVTPETYMPSVDYRTPATFRFLDKNHKFKPEYKAEGLPILNENLSEVFDIANHSSPYGSIAITKSFDDTITTSSLWQCAALAIVNKKEKVQSLLHFCPTVHKEANDKILDYLLKFGNTEDLEFTIIPGTDDITDNTMAILVDKIKEKHLNANIKFKYFVEDVGDILVLKNGELSSIPLRKIESRVTNPIDDIVYCNY